MSAKRKVKRCTECKRSEADGATFEGYEDGAGNRVPTNVCDGCWRKAEEADEVEARNREKADRVEQPSVGNEALPKNVQAILDWIKTHRPDLVAHYEALFGPENRRNPHAEALIGMVLMGFEAGRVFQAEHPEIESGVGYAP